MARKRMIDPDFWVDEKLADVSRDARLLFIGLWTFSDDYGNMAYSPKRVKAQVFPYDDLTVDDVSSLIEALVDIGVVVLYSVDGSDYLSTKNFLKHQHVNRPSATTIPSPHGGLHEGVMSPPPEEKRREEKRREGGVGGNNIFTLYEKNIGVLSPIIAETLKEAEAEYPFDWITDAFREAVEHNARNWKYIAKILDRWQTKGRGEKAKQEAPYDFDD